MISEPLICHCLELCSCHDKFVELLQRIQKLEESKTTKVMLDEVKKLFEEAVRSRDAYREVALKYWTPKNIPPIGAMFGVEQMKKYEKEVRSKEKIIDAEAQRILDEKKGADNE